MVEWRPDERRAPRLDQSAFELRVLRRQQAFIAPSADTPFPRARRDPCERGETPCGADKGTGPIQLGSFETKSHPRLCEWRSDAE
jgi:hypothetical protein